MTQDAPSERRRVLEMLANGKVTAAEAEQLLGACEDKAEAAPIEPAHTGSRKARHLRVTVADADGTKVNVRVPLQVLRSGIKLASLMPPEAYAKFDHSVRGKGINIDLDLAHLKPEMVDELIDSLGELTVDVSEGDGTQVRVFCE